MPFGGRGGGDVDALSVDCDELRAQARSGFGPFVEAFGAGSAALAAAASSGGLDAVVLPPEAGDLVRLLTGHVRGLATYYDDLADVYTSGLDAVLLAADRYEATDRRNADGLRRVQVG